MTEADIAPFETISYEVADSIATITLDRPEVLNALNPAMERELLQVWDLVDDDDDVRAVVVTGPPHTSSRSAPFARHDLGR